MASTLKFATFILHDMRLVSSLVALLFFCVLLGTADNALAKTEQNVALNLHFRMPIGENARYQFGRRSLEQSGIGTPTGSGSISTFDRRARDLREAKIQMVRDALKEKEFNLTSRTGAYEHDGIKRAKATATRRLQNAIQGGGIRLRQGTPMPEGSEAESIAEKRQRSELYRKNAKNAEEKRYKAEATPAANCAMLIGKRQAKCFYNLRVED